jgi:transcription-repair coupling factor (superfamily II helicase)
VAEALPTQERVAAELPLWDTEGIFVPEREIHINNGLSDPDLAAERLEALRTITAATDKTRVIVVTAAALNQQAPVFSADSAATIALSVGKEISPEALTAQLTAYGFERVEQVIARSQWSLRGGILDVSSAARADYMPESMLHN